MSLSVFLVCACVFLSFSIGFVLVSATPPSIFFFSDLRSALPFAENLPDLYIYIYMLLCSVVQLRYAASTERVYYEHSDDETGGCATLTQLLELRSEKNGTIKVGGATY